MTKAIILSIVFLLSNRTFAAPGPMEPSEFSQDFLMIFDLDHSGKLDQQELTNAFNASAFGKQLVSCTRLENDSKMSLQLWFYLFENGSLPMSLNERVKFEAYTHKEHSALAVDVKQIDTALSVFTTSCRSN